MLFAYLVLFSWRSRRKLGNHCQLSSTAFSPLNLKLPKLMVYKEMISSHAIGAGEVLYAAV